MANPDGCPAPAETLNLSPDIGLMSDWPWITISNHVVTIGDITDPTYDGESIIFTVVATDPIFDTNDDLVFQVDITAPCLTATINELTWINSPDFVAVDGSG